MNVNTEVRLAVEVEVAVNVVVNAPGAVNLTCSLTQVLDANIDV